MKYKTDIPASTIRKDYEVCLILEYFQEKHRRVPVLITKAFHYMKMAMQTSVY